MTSHTDPEALRALNEWYEAYRLAYIGWGSLATCVRAALARLAVGDVDGARDVLDAALRDHSPPIDG